jgi:hypothetical protein
MLGVEPSSEAPGHLRIPIGFHSSLAKIVVSSDVLIHFWRSFSKVCAGILAKYCAVGPDLSPLSMASMPISLGTIGA